MTQKKRQITPQNVAAAHMKSRSQTTLRDFYRYVSDKRVNIALQSEKSVIVQMVEKRGKHPECVQLTIGRRTTYFTLTQRKTLTTYTFEPKKKQGKRS